MANLGYVSSFNINGNELSLKDAALTEIVEEIIEAIGANNGDISDRINNLHERSFDALIKISSQNDSEIANIQDGIYKLQYVTITGEEDDATETLNNSAILIQKGTNQYLYKDGQISSRIKTNNTWGNWITFEGGVTSVNGQTGAVTVKANVQSDWNATSGDAVILNKPNINFGNDAWYYGSVNTIRFTGDVDIHVGSHDSLILNANDEGNIYLNAAEKAYYNNKEIATVDQIVTPPVTSVNGQTGAVTIDTGVTSFNGSTGVITYTAPVTSVNGQTGAINITIPTKTSDLTNDANFTTLAEVQTEIVGAAPEQLNTLAELADALNDDQNFASTVTNLIGQKYTKPSTGIPASDLADGVIPDVPVTSVDGKTGAVTIDHPVISVNGQTGAVTVKANVQSDWNATTGDSVILNKPNIILQHGNSNNIEKIVFNDYANINYNGGNYDSLNINAEMISLNATDTAYYKNKEIAVKDDIKVTSVNGQTGAITIDTGVTSFNGSTGAITYTAPVTSVNGQTGAVTIDHPVTSVNGATGAVVTSLSSNYASATGVNSALELAAGDTYEQAFGKLEKAITDNESVTSTAIDDLDDRLTELTNGIGDKNVIESISVNGTTQTITNKNVNIVETQLSKGTTTGAGNAVTDITVSNHQIILVKGATYATQNDINTSIANLVDSAPETLNTLNELAAALGDDPNFATTVATQIGQKYTKPSLGIPGSDLAEDAIPVTSVNGQTGAVVIPEGGVTSFNGATGAITYTAPVTSVNGMTGAVTIPGNIKPDWDATAGSDAEILNKPDLSNFLTIETQSNWNETNTSSAAYIQNKPTIVNSVNGMTGAVTINIPDVPVTSVNGMTGAVTINIPDVPVTSVNGMTGAVSLTIPTTSTSVIANDNNPVSGGAVYNKFADLIGAAPAALDTLAEIADALNNDADLAGTLTTQISNKVPKVSNPTTDNFASFNSDGTIKDSGHSHSDYITSIKTVNNESLVGTGNIVVSGLPQVSSADNGKILMVVNGQWQLVSPSVLYSGSGVPNNVNGNNGDLYMQTD